MWGEVPGGWAADWMVGEVRVVGSPSDPAADAAGQVLQVRLAAAASMST